jgi:hypothetical protein
MLILVSGCITTWEPQSVAPAQFVPASGETEVQVRLLSGARVVLMDPGVEGDSLVGWLKPAFDDKDPPKRRAYALTELSAIAVRKNDVGANVGFGVLAGTVLFFASVIGTVAVMCAHSGCD